MAMIRAVEADPAIRDAIGRRKLRDWHAVPPVTDRADTACPTAAAAPGADTICGKPLQGDDLRRLASNSFNRWDNRTDDLRAQSLDA